MLEEKDEVKVMNQMILYAKCMAVRDAQVRAGRGRGRHSGGGGKPHLWLCLPSTLQLTPIMPLPRAPAA